MARRKSSLSFRPDGEIFLSLLLRSKRYYHHKRHNVVILVSKSFVLFVVNNLC